MDTHVEITHVLPSSDALTDVIDLFIEAFEPKLIHLDFLSSRMELIRRVLSESIHPDYGFYAVSKGRVVGFLALEDGKNGGFFEIGLRQMSTHFGFFGGLWRYVVQQLSHGYMRHPDTVIRIECIAVWADVRGSGIGSRLLEAAHDHARSLGRQAVDLEVIDTNPGARALYERMGYTVQWTKRYGSLTRAAGFESMHKMEKKLV